MMTTLWCRASFTAGKKIIWKWVPVISWRTTQFWKRLKTFTLPWLKLALSLPTSRRCWAHPPTKWKCTRTVSSTFSTSNTWRCGTTFWSVWPFLLQPFLWLLSFSSASISTRPWSSWSPSLWLLLICSVSCTGGASLWMLCRWLIWLW